MFKCAYRPFKVFRQQLKDCQNDAEFLAGNLMHTPIPVCKSHLPDVITVQGAMVLPLSEIDPYIAHPIGGQYLQYTLQNAARLLLDGELTPRSTHSLEND